MRFSPEGVKEAFLIMKAVTKVDLWERCESSIATQMFDLDEKTILSGDDFDKAITNWYRNLQGIEDESKWCRPSFGKLEEITTEKALEILRHLKTNKKSLPKCCLSNSILRLCNKCLNSNTQCTECRKKIKFVKSVFSQSKLLDDPFCDIFFKARIILLSKAPKGQVTKYGRVRPISILSPIVKILSAYSYTKLDTGAYTKMSSRQIGYQKGLSTENNFLFLEKWHTEWLQKLKKNDDFGKNAYFISFDASNGFNALSFEAAETGMNIAGLNSYEKEIYMNLNKRIECCFGNSIKGVHLRKGMLQGDKAAGTIFCLGIEDVFRKLESLDLKSLSSEENSNPKLFLTGYVDDLAIIIEDASEVTVEKVIEIVVNEFAKKGIEISQKSKIVQIGRKRSKKLKKSVGSKIGGYSITNCTRYLGHQINQTFSMEDQLKKLERKFGYIYSKLWP